jgi:hypothetical protein
MTALDLHVSPLGRVEGDLDVRVTIEDGVVTSAWTEAAMFRGFEIILRGKDPQAGLIVTPRICGICGGSHLYKSAYALDTAWGTHLPPNATLIRNIAQGCETLQSIPRYYYALFAIDLTNKNYAKSTMYDEAVRLEKLPKSHWPRPRRKKRRAEMIHNEIDVESLPSVETTAKIIERFYEIGVYPDWWKLEPQASSRAWENISAVIARNDPWCRGVVLLGLDAPEEELAKGFAAASAHGIVKGFAVGRTIFSSAAQRWLRGQLTDEELDRWFRGELSCDDALDISTNRGWTTVKR